MQLIGQKHNLEIIDKWEELPQFLIIQGGPNTGKKYLTLYLCKKFGLRYSPMKNSVKNVRQLVEYMSPDKNEVYHFDNFAQLYKSLPLLKCGYTEDDVCFANPDDMNVYYPPDKQMKYGVIGIEIMLV